MALQASLNTAIHLQEKLSAWLASSGLPTPCITPSRQCHDAELHLPPFQPIIQQLCDAGATQEMARRLSDLYSTSAHSLAESAMTAYRDALDGLKDSHYACRSTFPADSPCEISIRLAEAFRNSYCVQADTMLQHLLQKVRHAYAVLPGPVFEPPMDYTLVLEFAYAQSTRLTAHDRALLARATGRSEKQIMIWFQNRRARNKTGASCRHEIPRTIEQLGEKLREQRQHAIIRRDSQKENTGHESHNPDHGLVGSRRTSLPSVDEITRLLEAFHLSDNAVQHPAPVPCQDSMPAKGKRRRDSTGIADGVAFPSTLRRGGKSRRRAQAGSTRSAFASPFGSLPTCVNAPAPSGTAPQSAAALDVHTATTLVPCSLSSTQPPNISTPLSAAPSSTPYETAASSTSSNKACRPRKPVSLPRHRPAAKLFPASRASSSSSLSTIPALSRSSSSSSLSTSSSDESWDSSSLASPQHIGTQQLYYRDANSGEFLPVTGTANVVTSPNTIEHGAFSNTNTINADKGVVTFGCPGQPVFAPDNDPRALSSNILGSHLPSAPTCVAELGFPCLEGSQAPGDDTAMPTIDSVATLSCPAVAVADNPVPLDVVNYAYDLSWPVAAGHVNTWAHLLGLEL